MGRREESKGGEVNVTKLDLIKENEELRGKLESIRDQINGVLDDDCECEDEEDEEEDADDEEA